ncbi:phosphotransferase family enzyme [Kribbella voronezhensis]|uniref:Phosphotransferase family enzyme n=1 Tax=Kribbella voronezhensis TaxID=2512212 RepID=A0A4R7SXD2_9ACTN|nr:aminoglycoside phosphotransferase family protein [Kribbella voronezhensis]TDU83934.1 phosphotransferase family enzyme [Kribbella voronezhensis]
MTEAPRSIQPRPPRSVHEVLFAPDTRGILIAASRDPDAKLTFIVTPAPSAYPGRPTGAIAVKIPATAAAAAAIRHETQMLSDLRAAGLGSLAGMVPQYLETLDSDGLPALVSTALRGRPMSVTYHHWLHTARRRSVAVDFALAGGWLRRFQRATAGEASRIRWAEEVSDQLRDRWPAHQRLEAALLRLTSADHLLGAERVCRSMVHGDYWFGNLLVHDDVITGVVDWECGARSGWPLRDLVRFAVSYCLYLDRHTRPGRRVLRHRGLRRTGFGAGISYGLLGDGWLPELVRSYLRDGLAALGLPTELWYAAALTGLGEVAALANDDDFGSSHLELLAGLPLSAPGRQEPGVS